MNDQSLLEIKTSKYIFLIITSKSKECLILLFLFFLSKGKDLVKD